MLSFLLVLMLTLVAIVWLVGHKTRRAANTPLPEVLTLFLVVASLCWLAILASIISYLLR